jgi:hypothetical protein
MTQTEFGKQDDAQEVIRRNRAEPVGRAASLGAAAFARAGFRDPSLVLRWAEIVGPEIARFAQPLKLSDGPSGGVLTLKAEAAASTFLQHETRRLCERINGFLGRPAVARLRFVHGAVTMRPAPTSRPPMPGEAPGADPARSFSGPDPLKSALVNLARARQRPSRD